MHEWVSQNHRIQILSSHVVNHLFLRRTGRKNVCNGFYSVNHFPYVFDEYAMYGEKHAVDQIVLTAISKKSGIWGAQDNLTYQLGPKSGGRISSPLAWRQSVRSRLFLVVSPSFRLYPTNMPTLGQLLSALLLSQSCNDLNSNLSIFVRLPFHLLSATVFCQPTSLSIESSFSPPPLSLISGSTKELVFSVVP